ncbi:vibriolysin [Vibrio variabilis]|uniref:Vibriolysin n=1 Tax=Vibrio variabilis TaxID=990271 RepID=A0ABQ0JBU6_9VIBR|nr:vibriolysin [Vibrio variabilis]
MAMSVSAAELVEMTDATKAQALIDAQFSIVPQADAYTEIKRVTLPNGKTKVKYQQLYQGLPVYDATITSTKGEQGISEVYGVMAQGLASDLPVVKPNISSDEALELAERHHFTLHSAVTSDKPDIENRNSKLMVRVGEDQVARMVYLVDFLWQVTRQSDRLCLSMQSLGRSWTLGMALTTLMQRVLVETVKLARITSDRTSRLF